MKQRFFLAALCLAGALLVVGESSAQADHFRSRCRVRYADSCSRDYGYRGYGYYSGIVGGYAGDYRGIYRGYHDGPRFRTDFYLDRSCPLDFYYRAPGCRLGY